MAKAILYLSDLSSYSSSVRTALEATGHGVVSTNCSTQAIALLFLFTSVEAVVLHDPTRKQASLDIARSIRAMRPEVQIILLSCYLIDHLPPCVDACVCTDESRENLTSAMRYLLGSKPIVSVQKCCDSLRAA